MKTDIQIAQEAQMMPIREVTAGFGITEDDMELYGKYKAKLSDELWNRIKDRPDGKLVLVTAINPTPAGEGKTTISIGLSFRGKSKQELCAWTFGGKHNWRWYCFACFQGFSADPAF